VLAALGHAENTTLDSRLRLIHPSKDTFCTSVVPR
jgi:hypothetical protein